jgi:galactonate dehydratase
MKIERIETIQIEEYPNMLWVLLHTDEGLTGLGETNYNADAVASFIHEAASLYLLGRDPLAIDRHSKHLTMNYNGYNSIGAEMRGASAIDIALWDIFGQATGQPIYQLLGGKSRERIRAYNTCAGYRYARKRPVRKVDNWNLSAASQDRPYEDLDAFLHRAGELALSLREEGFTAMKIWPFDAYAWATEGTYISNGDLKKGLEPFAKIRAAVGDELDIMVEMHSLWTLPAAVRIAQALLPYKPYWFEDPIRMDNLDALADFARRIRVPVTASETLATRWSFRDLLSKQAAGIIMFDVGWMGGISEAKKVSTMAEAWNLPVAPHDCTGPVVWLASSHLSMHLPNALIQECVRAFYSSWYRDVLTELPRVKDGYLTCPSGPGLGANLQPERLARPDVKRRVSRAE